MNSGYGVAIHPPSDGLQTSCLGILSRVDSRLGSWLMKRSHGGHGVVDMGHDTSSPARACNPVVSSLLSRRRSTSPYDSTLRFVPSALFKQSVFEVDIVYVPAIIGSKFSSIVKALLRVNKPLLHNSYFPSGTWTTEQESESSLFFVGMLYWSLMPLLVSDVRCPRHNQ